MSLGILVVEDEATHALALEQSLAVLGHRVLGLARDGREACQLRRRLSPDLVIMDIRLPLLDGFKAAEIMNRQGPLPVVLVTAHANRSFVDRARLSGVWSYLLKPVETAVLGPAIELALHNFVRVRELERQVVDLREELRNRKLIERAKGLLMERHRFNEAVALAMLEQEASAKGIGLVQAAEAVIFS
jgi:response regulator NasT